MESYFRPIAARRPKGAEHHSTPVRSGAMSQSYVAAMARGQKAVREGIDPGSVVKVIPMLFADGIESQVA